MAWRKFKFCLSWPDPEVTDFIRASGHEVVSGMHNDVDCVIFPGGEDILPIFYGQPKMPDTDCNFFRDMKEKAFYQSLDSYATPKIGICRGAQFLNVMSGGSLWQDVNNHLTSHTALMTLSKEDPKDGNMIKVSSSHHQMMIPGHQAQLLMSSKQSTRKENSEEVWTKHVSKSSVLDYDDAEVLYYWNTSSLCFQPHPEYKGFEECAKMFWYLAESYVLPHEPKKAKVG